MVQMCACSEHQFEFRYEDGDRIFICPICKREYSVYMDMEDDGELYAELSLMKDPNEISA